MESDLKNPSAFPNPSSMSLHLDNNLNYYKPEKLQRTRSHGSKVASKESFPLC